MRATFRAPTETRTPVRACGRARARSRVAREQRCKQPSVRNVPHFRASKRTIGTVPVARPAIYILVGCAAGERCVIERHRGGGRDPLRRYCGGNDWLHPKSPWEARIGGELGLVATAAEAAENSRLRRDALAGWRGRLTHDSFGWVTPPVLNPFTRIAVEMCPATVTLRVVGYEIVSGGKLPQPLRNVARWQSHWQHRGAGKSSSRSIVTRSRDARRLWISNWRMFQGRPHAQTRVFTGVVAAVLCLPRSRPVRR